MFEDLKKIMFKDAQQEITVEKGKWKALVQSVTHSALNCVCRCIEDFFSSSQKDNKKGIEGTSPKRNPQCSKLCVCNEDFFLPLKKIFFFTLQTK